MESSARLPAFGGHKGAFDATVVVQAQFRFCEPVAGHRQHV